MTEKTACFTGHRKIPPEKLQNVSRRLRDILIQLIENGYMYFGAGGALGFDTLAAQTVLDLKKQYGHIKLILVLPCLSQTKSWNDTDKRTYDYIKSCADKVVYISQEYTKGCMLKRNRHLVNCSSICICYLTKNTGGTVYTVKYAVERGLQIFNIVEKADSIANIYTHSKNIPI